MHMKKSKEIGLIANIAIPVWAGALYYFFVSPEIVIVKQLNIIRNRVFHFKINFPHNIVFEFIRNYFLDMLWAYALVFALFFFNGSNTATIWKIFFMAFSFSVIMEVLQCTSAVCGTFDLWDIVVEFLAEVIAVFIIKKYFMEERKE